MNLDRHVKAHVDLTAISRAGITTRRGRPRTFYDEYCAVTDLPAEFYLETVERVFQHHLLPLGRLEWRGGRVEPRAIRRTALFTVEGEKDDICAVGQTVAAQDLCTSVRPTMRRHHVQTGAGHYGVFNGARWRSRDLPEAPEPHPGQRLSAAGRISGSGGRRGSERGARPAVNDIAGGEAVDQTVAPAVQGRRSVASARGEPRARAPRD